MYKFNLTFYNLFIHLSFYSPQLPEGSSTGETTPTTPRFNLPGSRMTRGFPSPSSGATPSRLGGAPSSLGSSSSSDHTTSESSNSSAHEPPSRSLFPPGPSKPPSAEKTGLARPTSGPNLFNQGLGAGKGQRGSISALLSKSNPGKAGSKPSSLQLKNDNGGGKLSSHPLVSPQNSSRFRLPSSSGNLLGGGAGGGGAGRLGGNLISSRLVEKRGSASSSGSSSSSRQASFDFPPLSSGGPAKSLRRRCNTEPLSPFRKDSKAGLKFKPIPSGSGIG